MKYDVIIIGAGPGGIFAAYELYQLQTLLDHVRIWRSRCIFRWKIQYHQ